MLRKAVLVGGIALIVICFMLLVDTQPWPAMVWLNLAVAITVFLVNFANLLLLKMDRSAFHDAIPAVGILWVADGLYTLCSLGVVWSAYLYRWSVETALVLQLSLVFLLFIALVLSRSAQDVASRVQSAEVAATDGLDRLRNVFDTGRVKAAQLRDVAPDIESDFGRLRDELRYMSALGSKPAVEYEMRLLNEVETFLALAGTGSGREKDKWLAGLREGLTNMNELMSLRRNCRMEADRPRGAS